MADNKVDAASGGGDGTDGGCSWARARAVKDTVVYYLKRVPLFNFFVFLLVCPADAVSKCSCQCAHMGADAADRRIAAGCAARVHRTLLMHGGSRLSGVYIFSCLPFICVHHMFSMGRTM